MYICWGVGVQAIFGSPDFAVSEPALGGRLLSSAVRCIANAGLPGSQAQTHSDVGVHTGIGAQTVLLDYSLHCQHTLPGCIHQSEVFKDRRPCPSRFICRRGFDVTARNAPKIQDPNFQHIIHEGRL